MQDGCKVYMEAYLASNILCFMTTLTIFNNHLLDVGLTQNREFMALQTLRTVDLFLFLSCVRTRMNRNSLKQCLVEGPITYDFTLHLRIRNDIT